MREEMRIPRSYCVQHEWKIDLSKEFLDPSVDISFRTEIGGDWKRCQEKKSGIH
jgi:hypothetical protein